MIWAVAALAAASALAYQFCLNNPPGALRSTVKTVATGALAVASLMAGAPWLLGLALGLGALGDFFLSRPGQRAFLNGLIAFALAHLVYIALFIRLPRGSAPFDLGLPGWVGLAGLGVLVLSTARWLVPHTGAMRGPVVGYVLVIAAMAAAALHLDPAFRLTVFGAAMFLASDLILSVQIFRLTPDGGLHRKAGQAVWPLYWGGQALIALNIVQVTMS